MFVAATKTDLKGIVMSPTWIWMQAAIVFFVIVGMVIAVSKLA